MTLLVFSACTPKHKTEVDKLNQRSYAFHYRNLDSTKLLAQRALSLSEDYNQGHAEALNNLAFVSIMRMRYNEAYKLLEEAFDVTDSQIELLISDIQLMRLCQRQSRNKDFYDYRERALMRIQRINESSDNLTPWQKKRLVYARSEMNIVSAAYFYYVGQMDSFMEAMDNINLDELEGDTAQLLNYFYNVGAGGYVQGASEEIICQKEFEYLLRCYIFSCDYDYPYWQAQSLQAISEHMQDSKARDRLVNDNLQAFKFINVDQMPYPLLAGNMAQHSLHMFREYGDVYQTAGANRTLAANFFNIGDYRSSLICLQNALNDNHAIYKAPDLVASIREQLCLTYSALDDKQASDYNRNIYLDLQEQTRQDRMLESRADLLKKSSLLLNVMIIAIIVLIVVLMLMLFLYDRKRKTRIKRHSTDNLLKPLQEWKKNNDSNVEELSDLYDEINEKVAISRIHIKENKRRSIEQRSKIALVNSITPFIDRMINEVGRLEEKKDSDDVKQQRYEYISELIHKINDYNDVLTHWIQMRQGQLSLHIESFPLQSLMDIVRKGSMSYQLKNITLDVKDTSAVVKADKILTLFMINTIADNARKFTPEGGRVEVSAAETDDYVEISIRDNGKGMSDDQVAHAFDRTYTGGHGFGLLNCKGIIEKYKKISSIFNVCDIRCESQPGNGTLIVFRLPHGGQKTGKGKLPKTVVSLLLTLLLSLPSFACAQIGNAAYYADKAYKSNLSGKYDSTLLYSDSALNVVKKTQLKTSADTSVYQNILLSVYNETAVAGLALHNWDIYHRYNKAYTSLFNELSADKSLGQYVRQMQRSGSNKNVAIVILVLLLLLIFPAYYFMYYRHQVYYRICVDCIGNINKVLLSDVSDEEKLRKITSLWENTTKKDMGSSNNMLVSKLSDVVSQIKYALSQSIAVYNDRQNSIEVAKDELERSNYENGKLHISNAVLDNCLSTLKHETMYYPSRILQLIDGRDANLDQISQLVNYYKELYSMLSLQSMMQVDSVKIRIEEDSFKYIMELLAKACGRKDVGYEIKEKDDDYVIVSVDMDGLSLDDHQVENYFTPMTSNIDMLLCRQIIREYGEVTNMRGCGVSACRREDGKINVDIIIPKKICKTLKLSL